MKVMETRFQGWWDEQIMADFCQTQKRDTSKENKKSKALHWAYVWKKNSVLLKKHGLLKK